MTAAPDELLIEWGIHGVRSIELPESGSMNDTWLVEHATGRHVFRRHRRTERAEVYFEHSVLDWVRSAGVPVPEVLPLISGERVLEKDGAFFTVYCWAPGVQLWREAITPRQAGQMGVALANIHNSLSTKPFSQVPNLGHATTDAILGRIEVLCEAIGARADAAHHEGALDHLRSRAAWLESSAPALPGEPADSPQLIHGDYQHTNLFFEGDRVSSVIDWDKSRAEPPSMEVVRAIHYGLDVEPERSRAFLSGYRTERDMPTETLSAAAEVWGYHDAHNLWAFEQCYLRDDPRALRRFAPEPFVPFESLWERIGRPLGPTQAR